MFPEDFLATLDIQSKERILVLEADAATCIALSKRVPRGGVIGLHCSDEALRAARREARDVENVMFQPGDAGEIPFQDELFDWIFCAADPASFDEIGRVLAPGGFIVTRDPAHGHLPEAPECMSTYRDGQWLRVWRKDAPGEVGSRRSE